MTSLNFFLRNSVSDVTKDTPVWTEGGDVMAVEVKCGGESERERERGGGADISAMPVQV